jgi:catechol 2,3-dioxygenase-like lactoylglutathione lyase family enzyme
VPSCRTARLVGVTILRVDHVQLAMPAGAEADAVGFYQGLLEIPQVPKPAGLNPEGAWFEHGDVRIHLGTEADFRPARKAHPALATDDLDALTDRLRAAGHEVVPAETLDGYRRCHTFDPFGNRIELIGR